MAVTSACVTTLDLVDVARRFGQPAGGGHVAIHARIPTGTGDDPGAISGEVAENGSKSAEI
jgi:hypothetical protein